MEIRIRIITITNINSIYNSRSYVDYSCPLIRKILFGNLPGDSLSVYNKTQQAAIGHTSTAYSFVIYF